MPDWALVLVYWLHMTATVVWIGSVAGLALLVAPVAARRLEARQQFDLFDGIQSRLESVSWFCLFLIVATGLFQTSVNRNYHGLVRVDNAWEVAILTKIALVVVLALATALLSWGITPAIQRAKIRYRKTGETLEMDSLRRRERVLLGVQLLIAALILLATAVARMVSQ
jgi:uncharacterized membrane protein